MASLADRILGALSVLEGKSTASQQEITQLTADKAAAVKAASDAEAALATAQAALIAAGTDTQAETDAVVKLEAFAAQP